MAKKKPNNGYLGFKTKKHFDENTRQRARKEKTLVDQLSIIHDVAIIDIDRELKRFNALKKMGLLTCMVYICFFYDFVIVLLNNFR